MIHSRQIYHM